MEQKIIICGHPFYQNCNLSDKNIKLDATTFYRPDILSTDTFLIGHIFDYIYITGHVIDSLQFLGTHSIHKINGTIFAKSTYKNQYCKLTKSASYKM